MLPEQLLHYIGGKHLPSADGTTFEVTEPVTNRVYARAAAGGPEDVDRAAEAATAAFETGPWPGMAARARAAENFRFFADMTVTLHEDAFSSPAQMGYVLRKPRGVAGLITPWNTPFMLESWKLAPALASGCTVVLKPAEWTPLSASLLPEIMTEGGVRTACSTSCTASARSRGRRSSCTRACRSSRSPARPRRGRRSCGRRPRR